MTDFLPVGEITLYASVEEHPDISTQQRADHSLARIRILAGEGVFDRRKPAFSLTLVYEQYFGGFLAAGKQNR